MAQQKTMHSPEIICYATHMLGKLDIKHLKTILVYFYTLKDAYNARDLLVKLIDDLGIGKWPRPIFNTKRRKDSTGNSADAKIKNVIEDVISVLTYVDEQNLADKLTCFVPANPDFIPSSNWVAGDMTGIMNKFMFIETELKAINEYIQRSTISQQETLRCVL